jgi:hypothetical protein
VRFTCGATSYTPSNVIEHRVASRVCSSSSALASKLSPRGRAARAAAWPAGVAAKHATCAHTRGHSNSVVLSVTVSAALATSSSPARRVGADDAVWEDAVVAAGVRTRRVPLEREADVVRRWSSSVLPVLLLRWATSLR